MRYFLSLLLLFFSSCMKDFQENLEQNSISPRLDKPRQDVSRSPVPHPEDSTPAERAPNSLQTNTNNEEEPIMTILVASTTEETSGTTVATETPGTKQMNDLMEQVKQAKESYRNQKIKDTCGTLYNYFLCDNEKRFKKHNYYNEFTEEDRFLFCKTRGMEIGIVLNELYPNEINQCFAKTPWPSCVEKFVQKAFKAHSCRS